MRRRPPSPSAPGSSSTRDTGRLRTGRLRARRLGGRRSFVWRFRRLFFLVGLLGLAALSGVGFVLARVPLPEEDQPIETTFLFDADGRRLAELSGEVDRESVPLEFMAPVLVEAVLASEDRDFREHPGIDVEAIGRATLADLRGRPLQGGSTITQQYVKNVFLSSERTLMRKLKEATLAVKLERELDKDEILERYLNTVYFGRGAYGAQAASKTYFGITVDRLDLAQAAYLSALIRSPETGDANDPGNPAGAEQANRRRDLVLVGMAEEGYITVAEREFVQQVPVSSYVLPRSEDGETRVEGGAIGTQYFVEHVRRELQRVGFSDAQINGGGLRVHTTLDLELQRTAFEAVYVDTLDDPANDPAGALVSMDGDGHVVAMVGGRSWDAEVPFARVNFALGTDGGGTGRQAGSAFKPFVLAEAVQNGISLESALQSPSQVVFPGADAGEDYAPENFEGAAHGRINLIRATKVSSNTVYTQLAERLGPQAVADMAGALGIRSPLSPGIALALGSSEVSVIDMADAYLTFANRGVHVDPVVITKVTDASGGVELYRAEPEQRPVLDQRQADLVNFVLRQVVEDGTGVAAQLDTPAAGKTGTTQDNGDAWFVGYTPGLSTAVWMGYPEGQTRPMRGIHGVRSVTGGTLPADIWRRFMEVATEVPDYRGDFVEPDDPRAGTLLDEDLGRVRYVEEVETTTTVPAEADAGEDEGDDRAEEDGDEEGDDETTTTTSSTDPDGSTTSTTTAPPSSSTTTTRPVTSTTAPAPTTTAPPPRPTTTAPPPAPPTTAAPPPPTTAAPPPPPTAAPPPP